MTENEDVFFQTFYIKYKHPATGEVEERVFAGKALVTAKEAEEYKDQPLEILETFFDKPYNPYDDESNVEAGRKLVEAIRESLALQDNKKKMPPE